MKTPSAKIDAYIAKAPEYAKPILVEVRALFHKACPELEETIKWGVPHFDYHGVMGGMAAFKSQVRIGFWKAGLMKDPHKLLQGMGDGVMGALNVASADELPADRVLLAYIKEAARLNEQGIKAPPKKPTRKMPLAIPSYLRAELAKHPKARATFEAFSYSHKKEYVEWIKDAKQEATRARRLAQMMEWLAEGKSRNWKYERK